MEANAGSPIADLHERVRADRAVLDGFDCGALRDLHDAQPQVPGAEQLHTHGVVATVLGRVPLAGDHARTIFARVHTRLAQRGE